MTRADELLKLPDVAAGPCHRPPSQAILSRPENENPDGEVLGFRLSEHASPLEWENVILHGP
jgi:hypothetical protein